MRPLCVKPKPIIFCAAEGGTFKRFYSPKRTICAASVVVFEDGSVFDMLVGWRTDFSPERIKEILENIDG